MLKRKSELANNVACVKKKARNEHELTVLFLRLARFLLIILLQFKLKETANKLCFELLCKLSKV